MTATATAATRAWQQVDHLNAANGLLTAQLMIRRHRYPMSIDERAHAGLVCYSSPCCWQINMGDLLMKMLVLGVALAALVASPAFAQYTAYGAVTPFGSPPFVQGGAKARAAAIRQCSAVAAKYTEYTWGDMEIQQYRACMAEHGQVE
jgi:hypothetical protein